MLGGQSWVEWAAGVAGFSEDCSAWTYPGSAVGPGRRHGAARKYRGPSGRKKRGPQDDNALGWAGTVRLCFLGFAFQGAVQRLVERGFRLLVFFFRNLALAAFDFELEEFFLQHAEQRR